jgi:hypothetical protein
MQDALELAQRVGTEGMETFARWPCLVFEKQRGPELSYGLGGCQVDLGSIAIKPKPTLRVVWLLSSPD